MLSSLFKKLFNKDIREKQEIVPIDGKTWKRKCIIVLGMHRSGTSAMSAILKITGIYNNVTTNISPDNPKGFFEWHKGMAINSKIFKLFRSEWDDPRPRPYNEKKQGEVNKFKEEIIQAIEDDFHSQDLFAIKDPRISVLLPIYLDIFTSMNIEPLLVMMERPDEEIYQSLKKRNNFSRKKSYALSKKYKRSVYENISRCRHIIVNFDEVIKDPVGISKRIVEKFDLPLSIDEKKEQEMLEFIDPELKHHNVSK